MTKYVDEALHADARHEHVSPPLLQAGVRNDVLRRQLAPSRTTGSSISAAAAAGRSSGTGISAPTRSASTSARTSREEALAGIDLALGDLRQLPFADGAFTKAYALDVLEHLSREALEAMLREAHRVLAPGGRLFVYTHVRKNSRLAVVLRWINKLAAWLDRRGLIDVSQERLRKSDHLNPLMDVPDLERVVSQAGFRIVWIRFYTPIIGGFVENILMRLAERALARRASRRLETGGGTEAGSGADLRAARTSAPRPASRGAARCTQPCARRRG